MCLCAIGGDDRRVLLWKLEEAMAGVGEPQVMQKKHFSNIFCLSFNNDSTRIFSGANDDTVIVHDANTYVNLLHFCVENSILVLSHIQFFFHLYRCTSHMAPTEVNHWNGFST